MRSWIISLGAIAVLLLGLGTAQAVTPRYGYVDIGGVPNSLNEDTEVDLGAGTCLSNTGQVVGQSYYHYYSDPPMPPTTYAFSWTPTAGMTLLPTGAGSNGFWWAMGCNDSGTVVGQGAVAGGNAVMWTNSEGITPIPRIGGATGSTVEAECITDTGLIGGEDDGVGDAFVYNTNNSTVYDCGPDTSSVFGISNSGLAVGVSYGSRAFTWTASGGAVTLPSVNSVNSISANGTYVAAQTGGNSGGWGTGDPAIYNTLTQSTTTIGSSGICWSVNNSGTAVGSATIDGAQQAFLYSGGTLYSLTDLLASALPAGVTLTKAVSINNNGVILAQGDNPEGATDGNYYYNSFLLTVPGDANFDGKVDINDLTIVLAHYGQIGATWAEGEFTGDGKVDINDLTIVLANYGGSDGFAGAAMAAVPEPSALAIAAIALLGLLAYARKKRP